MQHANRTNTTCVLSRTHAMLSRETCSKFQQTVGPYDPRQARGGWLVLNIGQKDVQMVLKEIYYTPVLLYSSSTILQFSSHEVPLLTSFIFNNLYFHNVNVTFLKNITIYFDFLNVLTPLKFSK